MIVVLLLGIIFYDREQPFTARKLSSSCIVGQPLLLLPSPFPCGCYTHTVHVIPLNATRCSTCMISEPVLYVDEWPQVEPSLSQEYKQLVQKREDLPSTTCGHKSPTTTSLCGLECLSGYLGSNRGELLANLVYMVDFD